KIQVSCPQRLLQTARSRRFFLPGARKDYLAPRRSFGRTTQEMVTSYFPWPWRETYMLDVIVKDGPVMIPMLFCSVLSVAVALERLWYLYSTRGDAEDLMDEVKLALSQGKLLEAVQIAKRSRSQVAALVATGIAYSDRPREELREVLDDVGRAEVFKMEQRRSEEHTSELQSRENLVCRLLLEKKKKHRQTG